MEKWLTDDLFIDIFYVYLIKLYVGFVCTGERTFDSFILEQHRKIYNLANSGNIYKRQQNLSEFQGEMCLCFTPHEGGLSKNSS